MGKISMEQLGSRIKEKHQEKAIATYKASRDFTHDVTYILKHYSLEETSFYHSTRKKTAQKQAEEFAIENFIADQYVALENFDGASASMESCCGILEYNGLHDDTPEEQVLILANGLASGNKRQIVFTDVVRSKKNKWEFAKKWVSFRGPVTLNPSTGHNIQLYVATEDDIRAMAKELGY